MPTLKKFLACILLEQSFVSDWCLKIINHQVKDRKNLFLSIACEGSKSSILLCVSDIKRRGNDDLPMVHAQGSYERDTWHRRRHDFEDIPKSGDRLG